MVRTLLWTRNPEYLPMDLEHKKRRYQLGGQAGMCRIIHDWSSLGVRTGALLYAMCSETSPKASRLSLEPYLDLDVQTLGYVIARDFQ